jgi:hypothetical protein
MEFFQAIGLSHELNDSLIFIHGVASFGSRVYKVCDSMSHSQIFTKYVCGAIRLQTHNGLLVFFRELLRHALSNLAARSRVMVLSRIGACSFH